MNKKYYIDAYESLIRPVEKGSDLTTGRIQVSGEIALFKNDIAQIEGFLRLLWGEAFYTDGRQNERFKALCSGILAGVDKSASTYWGDIPDFGQLFVEMVSLSVFLIESKTDFWDVLKDCQKEQIASYMNQITTANIPQNNWQFFKVMVHVAFYQLESPYFSKEALESGLRIVNGYYLDEGFYADGANNSKDYYISWGFHYYGLLFNRYMKRYDEAMCAEFVRRTKRYLPAYLAHFDGDGVAVPFGRSLSYRFAQAALLSVVVLTKEIEISSALVGGLLGGHLRYWLSLEIFKSDGTLAVGYGYPNMHMAENYNSAGSNYWAFKFFALLSAKETDAVFGGQTEKLSLERQSFATGNFIAQRTSDAAFFYPVNNSATTFGYKDKYNKFVYNSKFAFSISKGLNHLEEGAFDNTLAIKDPDTGLFLTKMSESTFDVLADCLTFTWSPKSTIQVTTTIIPEGNVHRRVHRITTSETIEVFDMGFANDVTTVKREGVDKTETQVVITTPTGKTWSEGVLGYDEVIHIQTTPHTHLLFKVAVMTGVKAVLDPGVHVLESLHGCVYERGNV